MVENNGTDTCVRPTETFQFLQNHNLPIIKNHENSFYGKYTNYVELGKAMLSLFK